MVEKSRTTNCSSSAYFDHLSGNSERWSKKAEPPTVVVRPISTTFPEIRKGGRKKPNRLVFCIILFSSKSFVQPSDQGLMPLRDCESGEERRGVQTDRGGHALGDPMISRAGAVENYSRVRADGMPRRGGIR